MPPTTAPSRAASSRSACPPRRTLSRAKNRLRRFVSTPLRLVSKSSLGNPSKRFIPAKRCTAAGASRAARYPPTNKKETGGPVGGPFLFQKCIEPAGDLWDNSRRAAIIHSRPSGCAGGQPTSDFLPPTALRADGDPIGAATTREAFQKGKPERRKADGHRA